MTSMHAGSWLLDRSITDAIRADVLVCRGTATLRPDAGRLRYDEIVWLQLQTRPIRATRTYYYVEAGATIRATFEDGRMFFVAPRKTDGTATAVHQCGPDLYTGTLVLTTDCWETRWDVSGTKALSIVTRYTRPPSARPQISSIAP